MGPKSAGELDTELRIQRRVEAPDGYGNSDGEWADLCFPRFAKLRPTRGGEQIVAGRAQGKGMWDCWLWFDDDTCRINAGDRVADAVDSRRTWNVTFAEDMDGDRVWIFLQLEQGGADG